MNFCDITLFTHHEFAYLYVYIYIYIIHIHIIYICNIFLVIYHDHDFIKDDMGCGDWYTQST